VSAARGGAHEADKHVYDHLVPIGALAAFDAAASLLELEVDLSGLDGWWCREGGGWWSWWWSWWW
jgi:hypothetical protein